MAETKPRINQTDDREIEIDLVDLFAHLKQHIILIIVLAVAGALAAILITRFAVTPKYVASSSMYVVSASANSALDLTDLNLGSNLTNDYKKLVLSRTMLENVLRDTGEELSVGQLRRMVSVGNDTGTLILEFKITSPNKTQAIRLANSFIRQSILFLPEVMGLKDNVPTVIDLAIEPQSPSNQSYTRNTAIGLFVGVVIAVVILTVQYMLKDTFDSSDDLEKYLGVSPMAIVPENGQKHRGSGYYYYYTNAGKKSGSGKRGK
jgi:capsular polysaccharide biosynthesis protein